MGSTNHGTQTITWGYFQEAKAANWGKRLLDQLPVGIYSGGYLTRVTDSRVSLSAMVAEIRDGSAQVNVRTAAAATLDSTTLDSGSISSATPYLVLRWSFAELVANYVEVHAIASLSARQQNDIVVGKCVFEGATLSSFDYSDRTFPMVLERNLSVEATTASEMYVRVRGGTVNTGSAKVRIGDQKVGPFAVPSASNSRIDLVYVTSAGAIAIAQGTEAVSPSAPAYGGKMVLAEVTVVNGDTDLTWDRIADARSFLAYPQSSTTQMIESTGTDNISYNTAAWATITDMSVSITTIGGIVHITGSVPLRWGADRYYNSFRLRIDGEVKWTRRLETGDDQGYVNLDVNYYASLAAGVHTVDLQWYRDQVIMYQDGSSYMRYLQAVELS